jgi:hypothetical protein
MNACSPSLRVTCFAFALLIAAAVAWATIGAIQHSMGQSRAALEEVLR